MKRKLAHNIHHTIDKAHSLLGNQKNYDIKLIWNITKICGWDCDICCVDAFYVTQADDNLVIKTNRLNNVQKFSRNPTLSRYEDAKEQLIMQEKELFFHQKLRILNNIDLPVKIDFSGGDPLLLKDNLKIIEFAAKKIGKQNLSVTATGIGFANVNLEHLCSIIGNIDFTYDYTAKECVSYRPTSYNKSNLQKISELNKMGVTITAQIPLTKENISQNAIENIYKDLHNFKIDKILLMNAFPVGRGANNKNLVLPTKAEYSKAVECFQILEKKYSFPTIRVQTALRELCNNDTNANSHFASSHMNISSLGILSASPWAYDEFGEVLPEFILGDINIQKLSGILRIPIITEKYFNQRKNKNRKFFHI